MFHVVDHTKTAKSIIGQIEYGKTFTLTKGWAIEINRLIDSLEHCKGLIAADGGDVSHLPTYAKLDAQGQEAAEAPTVVTMPKANQVWISQDGVAYTVFSVRAGTVKAYTTDFSADRPNGRINGVGRVHWVITSTESFAKEFARQGMA